MLNKEKAKEMLGGGVNKLKSLFGKADKDKETSKVGVVASRVPNSTFSLYESDPVLHFLLRNVRNKHVRNQLFSTNTEDCISVNNVRILVGTYNVGGKKPCQNIDIADWIGRLANTFPNSVPQGADILALGFQEVVPLNAGNVMMGPDQQNAEAWDREIAAALNGREWSKKFYGGLDMTEGGVVGALEDGWSGRPVVNAAVVDPSSGSDSIYLQVASKQLVGVYLTVWVRKSLLQLVSGVQVASVSTGFGGFLGNKGGVAVRMRVYDSPLVFIASHLAAGDQEGDQLRRNADVADILKRCVFNQEQPDAMTGVRAALMSSNLPQGEWGDATYITDHENLIWCGDLNYRLNLPDEPARALLKAGRLEELQAGDQLIAEMAAGRVFKGWQEGHITFQPTYKYQVGSSLYQGEVEFQSGKAADEDVDVSALDEDDLARLAANPSSEEVGEVKKLKKRRTPAWTDRILWVPGQEITQLGYARAELQVSDHRPVCATFMLSARSFDRHRIEEIIVEAQRKRDMQEMAARPKCSVDPNLIELGEVKYGEPRVITLTLTNSSSVDAYYYFMQPPQGVRGGVLDELIPPEWLDISPVKGQVEGGTSKEITLTISIIGGPGGSSTTLPSNAIDLILIMRVEDGSDMFIALNGTFLPNPIFGVPLSSLPPLPSSEGVTAAMNFTPFANALPASTPEGASSIRASLWPLLLPLYALQSNSSLLSTPGLISTSIQAVLPHLASTTHAHSLSINTLSTRKALVHTLMPHIEALSNGELVSRASAHELAALVLLFLRELPTQIMPNGVVQLCDSQSPNLLGLGLQVLKQDLCVSGWAVLRLGLSWCRDVILAQVRCGVPEAEVLMQVAGVLADCWFPASPTTGPHSKLHASRAYFTSMMIVMVSQGQINPLS